MKYILLLSPLLFFFAIKLLRLNSLALLTALICDFRPFCDVSISLAWPQCPRQAPWPLGAVVSAGWPSFLLRWKGLKLRGRNGGECQKSQYFLQEHNSYVISVFIIYKQSNETRERWGGRARWLPRQTWQAAVFPLLVSDTTKAHSANPRWQPPFQLLVLVATQGS